MSTPFLEWQHFGPQREKSIEVPPAADDYVLAFNEVLGQIAYVPSSGAAWSFDGEKWGKYSEGASSRGENEHPGYYDPRLKGVVVWTFEADQDEFNVWYRKPRREQEKVPAPLLYPQSVLVTASGAQALPKSTGELPEIRWSLGHEMMGLFAFDPLRAVAVCLSHVGLFEIDAAGGWKRRAEASKLVPADLRKHLGGAAWDALGRRTIFWAFDDERYVFLSWDGAALTSVPDKGLETTFEYREPGAVVGSHADFGILLHAGPDELYALGAKTWSRLPTRDAPPRMELSKLAHDPTRQLVIVGPGRELDSGHLDAQALFYVQRNGSWTRQGIVRRKSPVQNFHGFHVQGVWYAVPRSGLQTFRFDPAGGFRELPGSEGTCAHQLLFAAGERGLFAVGASGAVYELLDEHWKRIHEDDKVFGSERLGFSLAVEPAHDRQEERLVVWGGEIKNRPSNDTLFFENGTWRLAKPSPAPGEKRARLGYSRSFDILWDSGLERMVRLGGEEAATLEGEIWKAHKPKNYSRGFKPVHDRRSGLTLIPSNSALLVRFDLKKCVDVAQYQMSIEEDGHSSMFPIDVLSFDPETLSLYSQNPNDAEDVSRLDLAPAFDAAAKLGPVVALPKAEPAAGRSAGGGRERLYKVGGHEHLLFACDTDGPRVTLRTGRIGRNLGTKSKTHKSPTAALEAAQMLVAQARKDGFVEAKDLPLDALSLLGAVKSRAIKLGAAKKKLTGPHAVSRLGGLPSGVDSSRWPKGCGFLVQLVGDGLLEKNAGLAVFCALDGSAPGSPRANPVIFLSTADLKKSPLAQPPRAIPALKVCLLSLEPPKWELDPARVAPLADQDPAIHEAFDRFAVKSKMQTETATKAGGVPTWLQDEETPRGAKGYRFLCQIDMDEAPIDLPDAWDNCELAGRLFVFVHPQEKDAFAMWQQT
jgi:hypothetical protein